jgi:hypothetical protein
MGDTIVATQNSLHREARIDSTVKKNNLYEIYVQTQLIYRVSLISSPLLHIISNIFVYINVFISFRALLISG